jgi:hypothetical protein
VFAAIGILIISCFIALYELPDLIKEKLKKESLIFVTLLIIGTTLSICLTLQIQIPNPTELFMGVFQPIINRIDSFLR